MFSIHSKWNDFEQYKTLYCSLTNWTLLGNSAQDCLYHPQYRFFCRNMQQRVVILWTSTVFLSTTGLFWAVPLQMSVRQTSVAKRLKPRKSSPPTYALRKEHRTLWDSMGSLADFTVFTLIAVAPITSLLTGSYGFLCSLITSVFLCPDLCC